ILKVFNTGGKVFDGIKAGIVNAFSAIVNALIGGINKIIALPFNSINGILNGIKNISILGAKPFSGFWDYNPLPVPQIPKLPAYEKGTNYVPETGYALLHKGETVVPAKQGAPYRENAQERLEIIQILMEMNIHLRRIYEKDTDIYMDSVKLNQQLKKAESKQLKALGVG
ncbi:hypothetical protein PT159_08870, partial [Erysipelothrix rhusiopathiae]|nr:hypothetical protein [Erysipelothrix rhusiopathiae]